jgi:3-oxoacyl-[acyl-carrier protein] reductase
LKEHAPVSDRLNLLDYSGKTILVTGGASGIGSGICKAFLAAGAKVAFTFLGSAAEAQTLVAAHGPKVLALKADLRTLAEAERVVLETQKAFGAIDCVIANAGGMIDRRPFLDTPLETWQEAFDVNVLTTVTIAKAVLPGMVERQSGTFITMSSISAHHGGSPGSAHYSAAKGAVHTLTRTLAKEMAPHGVRVNGVAPGLIGTRFHDRFSTAEKRAATVKQTPIAREGRPEDVAGACLYLASPLSSFLAGEIIEVNGGIGMF